MAKQRYEIIDNETGLKLPADKFFLQHMGDQIVSQVMARLEQYRDQASMPEFLRKMVVKNPGGNGKRS